MSKKPIIFLAIVVVAIASLFITNNIIGAKVASSVDDQLQAILSSNEATATLLFEYDEVTANPLGRSVTLTGFKWSGGDFMDIDMQGESVKLKIPLSEIITLAGSNELKSIRKMSIDLRNPVFKSQDSEAKLLAKSMKLAFDGEASLFEIERMNKGILPSTKQSIDINFQDMRWENIGESFTTLPEEVQSALGTAQNALADYRLSIDFDPYKKKLNVKRLEVASKSTSASLEAEFNFTGESFEDFVPKDGHIEMDYSLSKLKESLPEIGEYSINKVKASLVMDLDFEKLRGNIVSKDIFSINPIESLNLSLSIDKLKLEPSQDVSNILGQFSTPIDLSVFSMKKMQIDFETKNKEMNINTLTLQVDDMIDVEGSVKMEYQALPNQIYDGAEDEVLVFEKAYIEIESLSTDIDEIIRGLEDSMPKPFPRKNGKIIIDIIGPASNPIIKGVTD